METQHREERPVEATPPLILKEPIAKRYVGKSWMVAVMVMVAVLGLWVYGQLGE